MIEENRQFLFLKKHWTKIAIFLLLLAGAGFFTERRISNNKVSERQDCIRVGKLFSELQMGHLPSTESLEEMGAIVKRRPYLRPKYEQLLGVALLSGHKEEEALDHMVATLRRHQQEASCEKEFSEISLLIEKKEYEGALARSKELNIKLESDPDYPTMYAYSLLRTLFLAGKAEDVLLAKVTWDKLAGHPMWPQFAPLLQEEEIELSNYLNSCLF